jgi:type IX secretion system PorP/SprF family membrane protein
MRRLYIVLLSVIITGTIHCQQIPLSKEYIVNSYAISPAYAGISGGFEVFLQARKNLLGQVNSPEIFKFSVNGSVFDHFGAGLNVLEYRRGIFNTLNLETSYSYQILLKEEHIISFGLSAILINNRIDLASIDDLGDDPYFNFESNFSSTNMNFGTGIAYLYKGLRLSVTAPLLLSNEVKDNDYVVYNTNRTLSMHAGYVFRFNELSLYPMIYSHLFPDYNYWEGSLLCQLRNTIWAGLSFGKNNSVGICLGGAPIDNVIINYSYELSSSLAKGAHSGSHEINVGVLINKKRRYSHDNISMFKAYRKQPYHTLLDE